MTLQTLVEKLGIRFGPINVELVIDKDDRVFLIDVGPRSGGNMIPDLLGMIFGCDVVEMSIKSAMGEQDFSDMDKGTPFYATHNLHSDRDGIFQKITLSKQIEPFVIRKCIYKEPGDFVHAFNNASDAVGIVFLKFDTELEMKKYLSEIDKHISVIVE